MSMDDSSREISQRARGKRPSREPDCRYQKEETGQVPLPSPPAGPATYSPSHPPQAAYTSFSPTAEQSPSPWEIPTFEFTSAPPNYTMSRRSGHGQSSGTTSRPQQYQLISPGTPADPRNMSQVSPGFIFVIFPMFASLVCIYSSSLLAFPSPSLL